MAEISAAGFIFGLVLAITYPHRYQLAQKQQQWNRSQRRSRLRYLAVVTLLVSVLSDDL